MFTHFLMSLARCCKFSAEACVGARQVYNMATAAGMTEAAEYAKSIAPVNLIRALMPHTSDAQRAELLSSLHQIQ